MFPQTTLYKEEDPRGPEEIQIHARVIPDFIEGAETGMDGLKAKIMLTINDSEGRQTSQIEAKSSDLPKARFSWTIKGTWEKVTSRALEEAFDDLIRSISANKALRQRLSELAQDRELPAGLSTNIRFRDDTGILPNGRLDAGEEGVIMVRVANKGPGPAYDVTVRTTPDRPQVLVSEREMIGHLSVGESKEIAVRVRGTLDLPSTIVKLRAETSEKRGYGARPILLEVPTGQVIAPHLEIVDVTLNDQPSGRTQGDGDGQPATGETLEAVVKVRNAGPGEAVGAMVSLSTAMAEVLDGKAVLPRIAPNQVEEARLLLRLPLAMEADKLPLSFEVVEARGAQVAAARKEQEWTLRKKHPQIELSYRLYDGNSAGSTGNRDGIANNGERIEMAVTPANHGDVVAHGVKITVEPADPKLNPRPTVLEGGDLPVQAEGATQRFTVDIPRVYGAEPHQGDLRFRLTVTQRDFPATREPLTLSFRPLRPELSLETDVPSVLARGGSGDLVLRVKNSGKLSARDVVLEVTSGASGVDIINERGGPITSRKIFLGDLEPQGAAPQQRLSVSAKQIAALGPVPVRITLSQRDFPPVTQTSAFTLTDEIAQVIPAEQSKAAPQEPASEASTTMPATISFLRNSQGEHLIAEAIVLRFEVQTAVGLTEVRLTHNDRLLSLEGARQTANASSGVRATQYELPVQLEPGENHFEVVAVTRQGLRSSRSLKLIRDHEVGRLWVVAIGISKYQDPEIPALRYADADARAVSDYFRETFGLPESQVFLKTNEQATLREIKSVLGTQLATRANDPRDTVVLYLAGHGMRDRVSGGLDADGLSKYFLSYDASRNDLYSTALEMDEVTSILKRLAPERVVVLLDSCFSGAAGGRSPFDPSSQQERAMITDEFLDRMTHGGKGRVVLTASGPEESAQESSDLAHGVFTYYLLDGLRGAADLSGDGEIDVHEIYRYVSEQVARATHGHQNPKLKEPDLVGRILLGRGAVRKGR